jgi:hypothetical protein
MIKEGFKMTFYDDLKNLRNKIITRPNGKKMRILTCDPIYDDEKGKGVCLLNPVGEEENNSLWEEENYSVWYVEFLDKGKNIKLTPYERPNIRDWIDLLSDHYRDEESEDGLTEADHEEFLQAISDFFLEDKLRRQFED